MKLFRVIYLCTYGSNDDVSVRVVEHTADVFALSAQVALNTVMRQRSVDTATSLTDLGDVPAAIEPGIKINATKVVWEGYFMNSPTRGLCSKTLAEILG